MKIILVFGPNAKQVDDGHNEKYFAGFNFCSDDRNPMSTCAKPHMVHVLQVIWFLQNHRWGRIHLESADKKKHVRTSKPSKQNAREFIAFWMTISEGVSCTKWTFENLLLCSLHVTTNVNPWWLANTKDTSKHVKLASWKCSFPPQHQHPTCTMPAACSAKYQGRSRK